MVTILHTADVHLDRVFSGMGMSQGIAATRREELRGAVRRLVDLAVGQRIDAITIGGDLFEHERVTLDTGNFLRQQFERAGVIRVLISPGNHDPYVPDSLYRRIEWPENVKIFDEPQFRAVQVAEDVTVWGAAHDGPELRRNLLDGFRVSGPGTHVLLFHGSNMASVPEGKRVHAPFRPADVATTGAAFALLGHYHGARVHPEGFAYPGSPEALDFSEAGDHFALRLDISGGRAVPELVTFGKVVYARERIDVSDFMTSDQLRSAITGLPLNGSIARVTLEGVLQPEVDLDLAALYNACADRFAYLDLVDETEPGYDFEQLAEESTTKGVFVKLMLARMERLGGEEWETARDALVLGLRAFDRRELAI
jgi:DNA repair exonuclease SbcCD nuclease subunit